MSEIDITNCEYYKSNGKCRIPHYQQGIKFTSCNCDEWDCYYKQLQQLKEHCKQVDETNKILYQEKCDLIAENDEFKNKNNAIHSIADDLQQRNHNLTLENEELEEIRENLHKCNIKIMDEKHNISIKNIKLQQCLDEIEEKVKKLCKRCALDFKVEDVNSIPNEEYCDDAVCYFILQKIKEVKGNE